MLLIAIIRILARRSFVVLRTLAGLIFVKLCYPRALRKSASFPQHAFFVKNKRENGRSTPTESSMRRRSAAPSEFSLRRRSACAIGVSSGAAARGAVRRRFGALALGAVVCKYRRTCAGAVVSRSRRTYAGGCCEQVRSKDSVSKLGVATPCEQPTPSE